MSDVTHIGDVCGQEAGDFLTAPKHPANASGGGSSAQDSGVSLESLESWTQDGSKTDVLMTDASVEKSQFANPAKTLEIDLSRFDRSPPKPASEKQYASDSYKMEKIHNFDHGQNKEPSNV